MNYVIIDIREPGRYFVKIGENTIGPNAIFTSTDINDAQKYVTLKEAELDVELINSLCFKPNYGIIKKPV